MRLHLSRRSVNGGPADAGEKRELVSNLSKIHGDRMGQSGLVCAYVERATLRTRFSIEIHVNVFFQIANDLARQSGKSARIHALAQSRASGLQHESVPQKVGRY